MYALPPDITEAVQRTMRSHNVQKFEVEANGVTSIRIYVSGKSHTKALAEDLRNAVPPDWQLIIRIEDKLDHAPAGRPLTIDEANKILEKVAHDPVNHPKHYTSHPSGIECIQITRHMGFNLGNALKYVWRADLKENAIEDLNKAVWYIQDEIKMRQGST